MYTIATRIQGVAPLLQHQFGAATLENLMQGSSKKSGATDYSLEWLGTMFAKDGYVFEPSSHLEGMLVKAGTIFKVKGARGKTYKDAFRSYCYVTPDAIPLLWNDYAIPTPTADLIAHPTEALEVSVMRVVVQRSAVARSRLMIHAGWELQFNIEIHDEQLRSEVVKEVLTEGGRSVGIGDFRPRYGRFSVIDFQVFGE